MAASMNAASRQEIKQVAHALERAAQARLDVVIEDMRLDPSFTPQGFAERNASLHQQLFREVEGSLPLTDLQRDFLQLRGRAVASRIIDAVGRCGGEAAARGKFLAEAKEELSHFLNEAARRFDPNTPDGEPPPEGAPPTDKELQDTAQQVLAKMYCGDPVDLGEVRRSGTFDRRPEFLKVLEMAAGAGLGQGSSDAAVSATIYTGAAMTLTKFADPASIKAAFAQFEVQLDSVASARVKAVPAPVPVTPADESDESIGEGSASGPAEAAPEPEASPLSKPEPEPEAQGASGEPEPLPVNPEPRPEAAESRPKVSAADIEWFRRSRRFAIIPDPEDEDGAPDPVATQRDPSPAPQAPPFPESEPVASPIPFEDKPEPESRPEPAVSVTQPSVPTEAAEIRPAAKPASPTAQADSFADDPSERALAEFTAARRYLERGQRSKGWPALATTDGTPRPDSIVLTEAGQSTSILPYVEILLQHRRGELSRESALQRMNMLVRERLGLPRENR